LRYAGTVDGLAGLIADIETTGVADGVTLIGVSPRENLRALGRDVLNRLASRRQPRAS
jgi:alkanesulfonate monooxygenase SsuD/methylene tetrahydromethanopterin reductase-like flavin-dependent oxidoreductase (luciferase family)